MNKRIEELAEQANAWYPMGYPSGEGGDAAWENLVIFEKEDLEKFAKSIVRECAQVSEDDITDGDACCTNTAVRISRQIKKHFGVEE